jgi:hypothetical protein
VPKNIRRVVSGLDAQGRSVWASDEQPASYVDIEATGVRVTDIWRMPKVPTSARADHAPPAVEFWPAQGGLVFRVAEVPPMSSAKPEATHAGRAGMHQSNTVDLMVIISGELWGYQSDADEGVLLKQGDTFIQRGTNHAWENRTDRPCLFAVVLVDAAPAP